MNPTHKKDQAQKKTAPARRKASPVKQVWRSIRKPIAKSRLLKHALAALIAQALRLIERSNRLVEGSSDLRQTLQDNRPAIYAVWHGQHIMYPALYPDGEPVDILISKSADAEINAMVMGHFGVGLIRGSGGRNQKKQLEKGGARALLTLKKSLEAGRSVAMVADIPNGTPREAGLGIITLARLSGRPIIPVAYATSRRKVMEKTWDKMAINLPFGRSALIMGEPIHVDSGADAAALEAMRQHLTQAIDDVTEQVYALVDGTGKVTASSGSI